MNASQTLPDEFLKRLQQIIPPEKIHDVLNSFSEDKPITFRVNTVKVTTESVKKQLFMHDILATQVPWYPDAFVLDPSQTKETLMASELYKNGSLYIQSLSSMIPPLVIDPQPNQLICDLTAAPGSKTTQLAALMENTGTIIANDISRTRIYKLLSNLAAAGVTNTQTLTFPGQALWKKYPNFFDSVLVDAPCTMEGRFTTKDPLSFADWKPKKVKLLSKLQKYLLWSAFSATKPGGTIIYSTCTLEPEENEAVVEWLLQKEGDRIVVEPIDLDIADRQAGLTTWKKKHFSPEMPKTLRVLPSKIMEGFFVAKLQKIT